MIVKVYKYPHRFCEFAAAVAEIQLNEIINHPIKYVFCSDS